MTSLSIARTHLKIAARQRVLWVTGIPLTLFAWLLATISPRQPGTGGVEDLAFTAQMLAMFSGIAYAAAFTDYFRRSASLGIDELEASTAVSGLCRRASQLVGTIAVLLLPSVVALACTALRQIFTGNPSAIVEAMAVTVTISIPAALMSMSFSAFAGVVLPRVLGRITGVMVWLFLIFSTPLIPIPTPNGSVLAINGDVITSGYFGGEPLYAPAGPLANSNTVFDATVSLGFQAIVIACLIVAGTKLAGNTRKS